MAEFPDDAAKGKRKDYFALDIGSLRILGGWAADSADAVLGIYEESHPDDPRPRRAIDELRKFAGGGKRTQALRLVSLAALAAARESEDPAASAAARSASLAAASAYTHPLSDVHQTKHIVGPAAYAALALELADNNDPECGDAELRRALEHARKEICDILINMPKRNEGKNRIDGLMFALDAGMRDKYREPRGAGASDPARPGPGTEAAIRRPVRADMPKIEGMLRRSLEDTFRINAIDPKGEVEEEVAVKLAKLRKCLVENDGNYEFLVAEDGEAVVGLIGYFPVGTTVREAAPESTGDDREIGAVYIDPDHQRRGIGGRLFDEIRECLGSANYDHYFLCSGFRTSQGYWKSKLGEPDYLIRDLWGSGFHEMIWERPLREAR